MTLLHVQMLVFSVHNAVVWSSYLIMIIRWEACASTRCLKTFDSFWFHNVPSNGGGNGKYDTGQSTNQNSFRIPYHFNPNPNPTPIRRSAISLLTLSSQNQKLNCVHSVSTYLKMSVFFPNSTLPNSSKLHSQIKIPS